MHVSKVMRYFPISQCSFVILVFFLFDSYISTEWNICKHQMFYCGFNSHMQEINKPLPGLHLAGPGREMQNSGLNEFVLMTHHLSRMLPWENVARRIIRSVDHNDVSDVLWTRQIDDELGSRTISKFNMLPLHLFYR